MIRLVALILWLLSPAAGAEPLRIAVISDLNESYGTVGYGPAVPAAIADIIGRGPDLVLCTGDMVAGQRLEPRLAPKALAAMWAGFAETVARPLARAGIPLLTVPGNHDASAYPGFEDERAAYAAAIGPLRPDLAFLEDEDFPFRWAARMEGVTLIGLDLTIPGPLGREQADWLSALLGRDAEGPVIVLGHLPLYPVTKGRESQVIGDPGFHAMLRAGGVRAYLSGHHHAFAVMEEDGTAYVAQAALGAGPRIRLGEADPAPRGYTWLEIAEDGRISVTEVTEAAFVR